MQVWPIHELWHTLFSVTNSQSVRCKSRSASKVIDSPDERRSNPVRRCLRAVQCQCVHWCQRDGASSDANYPIVTVRSTPPPPLSQGCLRTPLTAGFVAQYARVRWLDSALRRLYSKWKACDQNRTLPLLLSWFRLWSIAAKIFDFWFLITFRWSTQHYWSSLSSL